MYRRLQSLVMSTQSLLYSVWRYLEVYYIFKNLHCNESWQPYRLLIPCTVMVLYCVCVCPGFACATIDTSKPAIMIIDNVKSKTEYLEHYWYSRHSRGGAVSTLFHTPGLLCIGVVCVLPAYAAVFLEWSRKHTHWCTITVA